MPAVGQNSPVGNPPSSLREIHRWAAKTVCAAAVVFDDQRRVLLVKHSYGSLNWEIPGGHAEPDEDPGGTALRELREETGLVGIADHLTGIYYENWSGVEVLHFTFRVGVQDASSEPIPTSPEITDVAFWPLGALPRPMTDFTLLRIADASTRNPNLLPTAVGKRVVLE